MFSWEIDNIIKQYNYNLPSEVYLAISDIIKNPQITRIEYCGFSNTFKLSTEDGYFWEFKIHN